MRLKKYGYTAEERSDGQFNICSLETAGKCIIAATLSYAALRALGLFKGQSGAGKSSTKTKKRRKNKTRKKFRS